MHSAQCTSNLLLLLLAIDSGGEIGERGRWYYDEVERKIRYTTPYTDEAKISHYRTSSVIIVVLFYNFDRDDDVTATQKYVNKKRQQITEK